MRIRDIELERAAGRAKIKATVTWEDCDRPPAQIFYETSEEFGEALSAHPHPFVVACVPPAMRAGEQRVEVEGEVCPELREGLLTAAETLRSWYGLGHEVPMIEARYGFRRVDGARRNAMFLTGGVDSLAALRRNRLARRRSDPGWIEDGIVVLGLGDIPDEHRMLGLLEEIARIAQLAIVPVRTNARQLVDDWPFWTDQFEGAVLASVAHAVAERIARVDIASSYATGELHPHGSHPLLDPCYGSADLAIRHVDTRLSRFEKTRVVAGWEAGLRYLRVCHDPDNVPPGALNCGACEKCVRTMLALVALGKLSETPAFPKNDLTPSDVARAVYLDPGRLFFHQDLLGPLQDAGREDLAKVIEYKIAKFLGRVPGWRAGLARLQKRVFRGRLSRTRRQLSPFAYVRNRRANAAISAREGRR